MTLLLLKYLKHMSKCNSNELYKRMHFLEEEINEQDAVFCEHERK